MRFSIFQKDKSSNGICNKIINWTAKYLSALVKPVENRQRPVENFQIQIIKHNIFNIFIQGEPLKSGPERNGYNFRSCYPFFLSSIFWCYWCPKITNFAGPVFRGSPWVNYIEVCVTTVHAQMPKKSKWDCRKLARLFMSVLMNQIAMLATNRKVIISRPGFVLFCWLPLVLRHQALRIKIVWREVCSSDSASEMSPLRL